MKILSEEIRIFYTIQGTQAELVPWIKAFVKRWGDNAIVHSVQNLESGEERVVLSRIMLHQEKSDEN